MKHKILFLQARLSKAFIKFRDVTCGFKKHNILKITGLL